MNDDFKTRHRLSSRVLWIFGLFRINYNRLNRIVLERSFHQSHPQIRFGKISFQTFALFGLGLLALLVDQHVYRLPVVHPKKKSTSR